VVAALCSAATFAVGSALQHRAASAVSTEESGQRVIARLLRRRSWVFGLVLSAVAFGLHALALSRGELALVQPVIVSGIVFAVLFRAALDRHLPSRPVVGWLILTWAGLALFVVVRSSRSAPAQGVSHEIAFVVVGVAVAGLITIAAGKVKADRHAGLLLGAAAGTLFGLVAGLLKLVTVQAQSGLGHALAHWSLWVLIVVGAGAVLLNQRAYQNARLSITAPMLNIAQVLVAITFGIIVFGERFDGSALAFVAEVAGLVLMGIGIWQLAAQPTSGSPTDEQPSDPEPTSSQRISDDG